MTIFQLLKSIQTKIQNLLAKVSKLSVLSKDIETIEDQSITFVPNEGDYAIESCNVNLTIPKETKHESVQADSVITRYSIDPEPGMLIEHVDIDVLPKPFNPDPILITENKEYDVSDYDLAEVDVQPLPPQTKEVTITENGTTEVTPDEGRLLDKVVVKADTTKANLTEFINSGGTLAAYKGTEMPEVDWDRVTITNAREFFAYSNITNYTCKLLTATNGTNLFTAISANVESIDMEIPNITNATQFLGTASRPSMQSIILRRFGEVDSGISGHFVLFRFPNLTHNSLIELFENLGTRSGKYWQPPIQLGEANYNKLTEDEIKIATDKGWTVTQ